VFVNAQPIVAASMGNVKIASLLLALRPPPPEAAGGHCLKDLESPILLRLALHRWRIRILDLCQSHPPTAAKKNKDTQKANAIPSAIAMARGKPSSIAVTSNGKQV
jgi:hypothetical protein